MIDPADIYAAYPKLAHNAAISQYLQDIQKPGAGKNKDSDVKPRYLLLIGTPNINDDTGIPTFQESGQSITGSTINSSYRYTDASGDGEPTLSMGRIAVTNVDDLKKTIAKNLYYESESAGGLWQADSVVAEGDPGWGGWLGRVIDWFSGTEEPHAMPKDYHAWRISYNPQSPINGTSQKNTEDDWSQGLLNYTDISHGSESSVDGISSWSLNRLQPQPGHGLGIVEMFACSTGLDLARKFVAGDGPAIAAIGAVDETSPQVQPGLARAFNHHLLVDKKSGTIGDSWKAAQTDLLEYKLSGLSGAFLWLSQAALGIYNALRWCFHAILGGKYDPLINGYDLSNIRRKHVFLYELNGDPATPQRRPALMKVATPDYAMPGDTITTTFRLPPDLPKGTAYIYFEKPFGDTIEPLEDGTRSWLSPEEQTARQQRNYERANKGRIISRLKYTVTGADQGISVTLPPDLPLGDYRVRIAVIGDTKTAIGYHDLTAGTAPPRR